MSERGSHSMEKKKRYVSLKWQLIKLVIPTIVVVTVFVLLGIYLHAVKNAD